jgi:hypothetical protein
MLNDVNKSLGVEYSAKLDVLAQFYLSGHYGEEEYDWFMNELEMMSADARNTLGSVASLIYFRLLKIEKKGISSTSIHDLHIECMKEDGKEITQIILKRFVESDLFNPYDWSMN